MKKSRFYSPDIPALASVGLLLAIALSSASVQYTDLDQWMLNSYARIITTAFITMVMCLLIFKSKITVILTSILIALTAVAAALLPADSGVKLLLAEEAPGFFIWLRDFIFNWEIGMEMPDPYVYIMTISITALITIMLYFTVVRKLLFLPSFIAVGGIFTAQWIVTREVNRFAFYSAFIALALLYMLYVRRARGKEIVKTGRRVDYLNSGKFIYAAVPVVLTVLLIALIIPKSSQPIQWKWLDDRIKYRDANAYKNIDYKAYDHFSLALTGFSSEAGKPGGPVELDYSHILDVYSDEILYLRGKSWPYFDGVRWGTIKKDMNYSETISGYTGSDAERKMLLEPVYGWKFMELGEWLAAGGHRNQNEIQTLPGPDFRSVTGEHLLPGWYGVEKTSVVYKGVETKTLFSPLYSRLKEEDELPTILIESDATLEADERIRLGSFTNYDYLSLERGDEEFLETIRKSRRGIYEEVYSHLNYVVRNSNAYQNIIIENTMYDTLADLFELYVESKTNYWRYTAVSENLPGRVYSLARDITGGLSSDYDRVKAIEEYFTEGFVYTLNAQAAPPGRDFVDWFLFDYKQGYCTYYATAMSVMVKSLGIPARYVEGFVTPAVSSEGDRYTVLNSNAHSWVEVYFEGVGWVTFEPTPPFAAILNSQNSRDPVIGEDMLDNPDMEDYLDELDKYEGLPAIGGGFENGSDGKGQFIIIVFSVLGLWLTINLCIAVGRNMFFKKIKTEKRFRKGYFAILNILKTKGFKRNNNSTLMEFAAEIDDVYYMAHISMRDLTMIYYSIMYSDKEVSEEELRKMETFYKEFRKEFNSEVRAWEWLIYRILLPVI